MQIQNHLIHRFFEDPMASLSSIKDDDHLAAYRIPQPAKGTIFLQLIHRLEDKYVILSVSCTVIIWLCFQLTRLVDGICELFLGLTGN